MHKISLEQWRAFIAVVDYGGFAQAGDALFKTQSTISHSIKKLEQVVGKPLFDVVGRKAVLTSYGASLLVAARTVVTQADNLEHEAISQKSKIQQSLKIAVDTLFPRPVLGQILTELNHLFPELNIQLHETVLSRCSELLQDGSVDIGIASLIPSGFTGHLATTVELYAVVHQSHQLMQQSDLQLKMLEPYKQVVIRDAGLRTNSNSGWLGSESRLTVSTLSEAVFCVKHQLGFAWLPDWLLQLPDNNDLVKLPLQHGFMRTVALQAAIRQTMAEDPVIKALEKLFSLYLDKTK